MKYALSIVNKIQNTKPRLARACFAEFWKTLKIYETKKERGERGIQWKLLLQVD